MDDIQIEPKELKVKLDTGAKVLVVDVREPWEVQIASIAGATLVPLNSLPANMKLFDGAEEVVIFCHHGMRSLNAAAWLRSQGVDGARSLTGGIERWSTEIDPSVPHY
ncbi:MAG TPA: rhodanese-like domain-containing protein [Candidatus Acidoferrales bacterium]|nr:rhodanese-like domain-containing protein [Candidatus Acidoferrales bacterium]